MIVKTNIREYAIACGGELGDLADDVNEYIKKGFQPYSTMIVEYDEGSAVFYIQPMVIGDDIITKEG